MESELWQVYRDQGLLVLAIGYEPVPKIQQFVDDNGSTFPIVLENGSYDRYQNPGPGNYSLEILIDRDGVVRFAAHGTDVADLIAEIEPLL